MNNIDLIPKINALLDAIGHRNSEIVIAMYAENAVLEVVPEGLAVEGKKTIGTALTEFFNWVEDGRVEIKRCCQDGLTVWVERVDHWKIEGKWIALTMAAVIDFNKEGQIVHWNEYLTLEYQKQFKTRPKHRI